MNRRTFCAAAGIGLFAACARLSAPSSARVFIIHGYGATVSDHWFAWLEAALVHAGISARRVALPDSGMPDFDRWQQALADAVGRPSENDIFVAHSLGTVSVLHYLSALRPKRIGGLVLVSAFGAPIPTLPRIGGFDVDAYVRRCILDFPALRVMTGNIELFAAADDTIVPPENTRLLAQQLDARLTVVPHGGHFLASDGFTELPPVLQAVRRMASRAG